MSNKEIQVRKVRDRDLLEGKTFFLIEDCEPYVVVRKEEEHTYLVNFDQEDSSLVVIANCTSEREQLALSLAEACQGKVKQIEWSLRQAISNRNNEGR